MQVEEVIEEAIRNTTDPDTIEFLKQLMNDIERRKG